MSILDRVQGYRLFAVFLLSFGSRSAFQQFRFNPDPSSPNPSHRRLDGDPDIISFFYPTKQIPLRVFYHLSWFKRRWTLQRQDWNPVYWRQRSGLGFFLFESLCAYFSGLHVLRRVEQSTRFPDNQMFGGGKCFGVKLKQKVFTVLIDKTMSEKKGLCVSH